jgi:hypothetical protein
MSSLYLSQHEMTAIKMIDTREVEQRVDQALDEGQPTALHGLNLSSSGSHIATHLRRYERDLANYARSCPPAFSNRIRQGLILPRFILRAGF